MVNPVGNQVSQPFVSQEHASQQNVTPTVRVGQEASAMYTPNSAEWVRTNPATEPKEKERIRQKHEQEQVDPDCETCRNRRYQDRSSDPGVSFQAPQHIPPEQSASAVLSHEAEHLSRDRAYAEMNSKEVLYQRIALQTDICSECGKIYVSGGQATTVMRGEPEQEQLEFAIAGNLLNTKA